jgi:hypothetical protein
MQKKIRFTDAFGEGILTKYEKNRYLKLMVVGVAAAITDVLVVGLLYPFIALLSGSKIQGTLQHLFEFFRADTTKQQICPGFDSLLLQKRFGSTPKRHSNSILKFSF